MSDESILTFLLTLSRPTFFTRDLGFAHPTFCHEKRCLIIMVVGQYEVAHFVRRVLQHSILNTHSKRMGAVIRVTSTALIVWYNNPKKEIRISWR
jgi:hypothetical protein